MKTYQVVTRNDGESDAAFAERVAWMAKTHPRWYSIESSEGNLCPYCQALTPKSDQSLTLSTNPECYNCNFYDPDPNPVIDEPDPPEHETMIRPCERCQTETHCELIPLHGYSEWLCKGCAAAAWRCGDAV